MSEGEDRAEEMAGAGGAAAPAPVSIFINYRREDTSGYARALYQELKAPFGAEHIFIDAEIPAGAPWLQEIKQRSTACGVFLALVGPDWLRLLRERSQGRSDDYVRLEIEGALKLGSNAQVIPVLFDDTPMPAADALPFASIRALVSLQEFRIRNKTWDDDLRHLIERIEQLRLTPEPEPATSMRPQPPEQQPSAPEPAARRSPATAPAPDESHYEEVAEHLIHARRSKAPVVIFLGPGVNASDRRDEDAPDPGEEWTPDSDQLAQQLAREFGFASQRLDLAQVSQYVYLTEEEQLYTAVKSLLRDSPPTSVHRMLARLPTTIGERGYPGRYQLIVTSNYDQALERAFREANQAYDLVVYMASGDNKGKFLHVPYDADAEYVPTQNNVYTRFPISVESDQLERTIIVKIHGAVESSEGSWTDNYVMTEDQYINYLVKDAVPSAIVKRITTGHCLFLGYSMRDWNLRVFLQRMWDGKKVGKDSWAIERTPGEMERHFCASLGKVFLFAAPLHEYALALESTIAAHPSAPAEPNPSATAEQ